MTRVLATLDLPLVKAIAPARFSRPISVISSPLRPLRHGRHDVHVDEGVVAGAALDEIDERHLVDDGLGVGHHDDGRDAAGRRGVAGRLQGLAVLLAGLAGEHLHVDQAGAQHVALAVDDLRALVRRVAPQMAAQIGDHAVPHQQPARLVLAARPDRSGGR